jgi:hypothetical protein
MKNKVKGMEFFSAPGGTLFLFQRLLSKKKEENTLLHLGLLHFKIILCDAAI